MKLVAVALCGSLLAIAGCGKKPAAAADTASGHTAADSGIVELQPAAVANAGIHSDAAGPATLDVTIDLPGEVRFDPQRLLDVKPRFAGVVRQIRRQVGEYVGRGDVVAMIESNESLTDYAVTSAISGRVIARPAAVGQAVTPDVSLLTIADLSTVWVEFAIYPNDLARIRPGAAAVVAAQAEGGMPQNGTVSYVGPSLERGTGVSVGRVVLANRGGHWEPGLFATVTVTVSHADVPVAVPNDAVVRTDTGPVVFIPDGNRFRKVEVRTGRSDRTHTEILEGLTAGTPVVDHGAFVLRSELEKANVEE